MSYKVFFVEDEVITQLDQEHLEQNHLKNLRAQAMENREILRDRLLFKLIMGAVSPVDAIEKGHALGVDLSARHYLVLMMKLELVDRTEKYDYDELQKYQGLITEIADKNPDIFLLSREWGETTIIMKGSTPEYLEEERDMLLEEINRAVQGSRYQLMIGVGSTKKRIEDICQSYVEALAILPDSGEANWSQLPELIEQV